MTIVVVMLSVLLALSAVVHYFQWADYEFEKLVHKCLVGNQRKIIVDLMNVNVVKKQQHAIEMTVAALKLSESNCAAYRASIASLQEENDRLMMLKNAVESLASLGDDGERN